MSTYIDTKGGEYAGDNTGHWLKAYVDHEDRRLHKKIDEGYSSEKAEREAADDALQAALDDEAEAREAADNTLQSALNAHENSNANPHAVTKAQVGLGNVDNTTDLDKPISTAAQAALDVEKSAREMADTELQAAVAAEIESRTSADATLQTEINSHTADSSNPHGVTKAQVGLDNVDNTADLDKPVSTATQVALDAEKAARETADENLQTELDKKSNTTDVNSALSAKADISSVLTKTNTTSFTPTSNYHPATKKYVDDSVSEAGGGDMLKTVYDMNNSGSVDDADKLGGRLPEYYAAKEEVIGKSLSGQTVKPDIDTEKTAGTGAEIFNDYRERTFDEDEAVQAGNVASGVYSHAEGSSTTASGGRSHAEGSGTTASGSQSHAEGSNTTASGSQSHAEGSNTTASGSQSHAEGGSAKASGGQSHAEGYMTTASSDSSHAEGYMTTASGSCSHAEGRMTKALGEYSHAGGYYTTANKYQTATGRFNIEKPGDSSFAEKDGTLFIVGNGTANSDRSNAFRVDSNGEVYGVGAYNTTGADYAEYFEWTDGNPEGEDRRGLFVTLDGEKLRLANAGDDYVLGVISANPSVVGDAQEDYWRGKYLTDVFGVPLIETVTVDEYTDEETDEVIPQHDEKRYVINPAYNPDEEYISRDERPEWAVVGMMGKLTVVDDGSCEVNGYCRPTEGGIATKAENGYRVMKRIDDTHIKILFR